MAITKDLQTRFRFFHENAGYCVGRRAAGALALAKAEQAADGRVIFDWEYDPHGCDCDCENEPHSETLVCCARDVETGKRASLGGICDPGTKYARVVEAELAAEIFSEIESEKENDRDAPRYMAL